MGGIDSATPAPGAAGESGSTVPPSPAGSPIDSGTPNGEEGAKAEAVNGLDSTSETRFAALFEDVLRAIVTGVMPLAAVLGTLQVAALPLTKSERPGRADYGMDRLSHLTLSDALRPRLPPGQDEIWRGRFFGAPALPGTPPPPRTPMAN